MPGDKSKRVALCDNELAEEIALRLKGLPIAYDDGHRIVPVVYDMVITPLVSDAEYAARDKLAATRDELIKAIVAAPGVHTAAYRQYVNAQRSDDGVGTSFMTTSERALASLEWGQRLRDLIEAGKRKDRDREERRVLVDLQCEDE
jgi:hypothetical protein